MSAMRRHAPERKADLPALRRLGALVVALAGLALIAAGPARASDSGGEPAPEPEPGKATTTWSLSAADAAGWLVFPGRRGGEAQDYTPSTLRLRSVTKPGEPQTPGMDWLDRWGPVQSNLSR
jgi:hypothetical protein